MSGLLGYTFFQHALLGALLASVLCAVVGTYVVTRRLVIAGGGVAHASLGGVGMGAYFGFNPLLGAAVFAVASGFAIQAMGRRAGVREDSAVAMLWTLGMSLGILFAYLAPGFMADLPAYLFGDVLSITRADLWALLALTAAAVAFVGLWLLRWRINLLTLGDEEARTMGVNVKGLRGAVIVCATLITAASVSASGMIGWVGLVIPHLGRKLVGDNYQRLMPTSMLLGAIFLLLVDDVSRNLLAVEIPIGILTSFLGAPFFLYLISREGELL